MAEKGHTELLPCPFCGGEAGYEESFGSPTIRCIADHCYVRPIFRCFASKDEVIQQWNTRPVSLDREALARIIDPDAFAAWDMAEGNWRKDEAKVHCWPAEEKADAILALIEGRT